MTEIELTGQCLPVTSTVGSFLTNLPEFLGALLVDPRCIVAIVDFSQDRYVQFWLDSPTDYSVEFVSNAFLSEGSALSELDESTLAEFGFSGPAPEGRPNWYRTAGSMDEFADVIRMTASAVREVISESPSGSVMTRTFEVERRCGPIDGEAASPWLW